MPLVLRTVCRNRVPTHSSDPARESIAGSDCRFGAAFAARRCASVGPHEKYRPAFDHLEGGRGMQRMTRNVPALQHEETS